jgi:FtsP/CotA-like multicopper oxidase with cupredoxin domain
LWILHELRRLLLKRSKTTYFLLWAFVGQSFGFASELPLGPELALLRCFPIRQTPTAQVNFFITVNGQTPTLFNPNAPPAIITTQGSVGDWTIENRALENHEFHMHQIHFLLMAQNGVSITDGQYLDMINIPYWSGKGTYPSVTVRMDFRGPDVGDFVYQCHILGHEDSGMMAIIRVNPR